MKRPVQYFSNEALLRGKNLSVLQIITFVENFRILHSKTKTSKKSKLISIKIPEELLESFKISAEMQGIKYQTLIKKLMLESLMSNE